MGSVGEAAPGEAAQERFLGGDGASDGEDEEDEALAEAIKLSLLGSPAP
jgi:hypothetical protein